MELPSKSNEFTRQEQYFHKALIIQPVKNRTHNIEKIQKNWKTKIFLLE